MSVTNGDENGVIAASPRHAASPFERIKRVNDSGAEYWSSRDFAGTLGYGDYRNFESVLGKARMACFQSTLIGFCGWTTDANPREFSSCPNRIPVPGHG